MKFDMLPGHSYDLVSNEEMQGHVARITNKFDEFVRAEVQGIKPIRFTTGVQNMVTNIQAQYPITNSPKAGYIWAIMRVAAFSNAAGSTSMVLYKTNDPAAILPFPGDINGYVMAFGNGTIQNFSKGQLLLNAGEYLSLFVLNTTNSGPVIMHGEAIEVPAEMIGKLLL